MRTSSAFAASVGSFAASAVATASWSRLSACAKSPIWISASPSSGKSASRCGSSGSSSAVARSQQVRRRRHVAALERAPSGGGELGRGRARRVVRAWSSIGPSSEEVAVRLLEVVAEDLLVLGLALAVAVDLLGPVREPLVQRRARPLEHAVVRGVADQDVLEAEVGPPRSACRGG